MATEHDPDGAGSDEPDRGASGPILVAVDFSDDSREALVWASRQAERMGNRLLIFHVVHEPVVTPGFYRRLGADWLRPMADLAHEMMASYLKELRAEHPALSALASAESRLVTGLPAARIVEVAKAARTPLIVVGSRGQTGLRHILMGSVAERVVQLAPMPVVVVKAA